MPLDVHLCVGWLETCDQEVTFRVEEDHDSIRAMGTTPGSANGSDEVDRPICSTYPVREVDAATRVEDGLAQALKILFRRRVRWPLQAIHDVLIILPQDVGVDVIAQNLASEEAAQPSNLFWRDSAGATGFAQFTDKSPDLHRVAGLVMHTVPLLAMIAARGEGRDADDGASLSGAMCDGEAVLDSPCGDLCARGQLQFAQDVADVGVDGPLGERELLGDLAVAQAQCDEGRYLPLTPGQTRDLRVVFACAALTWSGGRDRVRGPRGRAARMAP